MAELPEHITLVHDWLTGMRGGEKCLEVLCELYPEAPVFTLLAYPEKVSAAIRSHEIHHSFLQRMPKAESRYRHYLPLFPRAIESLDLSGSELVVSSSHAVAKGVLVPEGALHISYVYTPMRYVWDMFDQYFSRELVGGAQYAMIRLAARYLRRWDVRSSSRVHHYIAISSYIGERIQRIYGRESAVIYPPVDIARFTPTQDHDGSYLVFSALVPYKRVDLAIAAFNELGLPLRVIGDGPENERLRSMASDNITFEGWLDDAEIETALGRCRALIFPGEEDFGIIPVEAMASGKPVIAFGKGGATETVVEGVTGTFFDEQTVEALKNSVRKFEQMEFDSTVIRTHAETFNREIYREKMDTFIREKWAEWQASH